MQSETKVSSIEHQVDNKIENETRKCFFYLILWSRRFKCSWLSLVKALTGNLLDKNPGQTEIVKFGGCKFL